jgi:hypothetical protein
VLLLSRTTRAGSLDAHNATATFDFYKRKKALDQLRVAHARHKRLRIVYVRAMRLQCPCGETLEADDEDTLVAGAQEHLEAEHPELAGKYTREDILFLAY